MAGEPCLIRNPVSYRPWQFALEPLRGYLLLAERLSEDPIAFASGWNFGPVDADVQPVSLIADTLVQFWGDGAAWQLDSGSHPHEARALKLDASKAGTFLNWHPVLSLAETLAWIVEWYRGFQQGSDMRELTLAQIQRYEALIGIAI